MVTWYQDKPLIIGHRGASIDAPENTLAAFSLAKEQGADGIEFDVQLSADGVPVVIHDTTLERTTNGVGKVSDFSVSELKTFNAGNGQSIPSLEEVLTEFNTSFLYNIEIKGQAWQDNGLEKTILKLIHKFSLEKQVVISSFSFWSIYRVKKFLSPQILLGFLHMPIPPNAYRHAKWLIKNKAVHPPIEMITPAYMAWAQHHHMRVHTWTVDQAEKAQQAIDLGIHALITNCPNRLLRELNL